MKIKWRKHLIIFLCVFALCGVALWGASQIWFNPYRGTVSDLRPSEELETVLTSRQAVEDLDYLVHLSLIHIWYRENSAPSSLWRGGL